jgi:hypothetical protein
MRVGARVWKTALAVAAAIAVSRMLGLQHPVFAGVAAIICMQPTIAGSLRKGVERMQATIIGAAFSLLALIVLDAVPILQFVRPAIVGLTVLVVMAVTIRLGWLDSLVLAAATVVVIMILPPDENIYFYAGSRTVITFVGIVVASLVNATFLTPRYSGSLWHSVADLVSATNSVYRQAVEAFCFRNMDLVSQAQQALENSQPLVETVSTTMEWVRDEARLRERVGGPHGGRVETLLDIVEHIAAIRASTATILRVTTDTLRRVPEYADHPARVYEILWELAQLSFTIFDQIESRLDNGSSESTEMSSWTEELHSQLVKGIREGYKSPRDIFPLVEVSVVAFEIRRATELLAELDRAIPEYSIRDQR